MAPACATIRRSGRARSSAPAIGASVPRSSLELRCSPAASHAAPERSDLGAERRRHGVRGSDAPLRHRRKRKGSPAGPRLRQKRIADGSSDALHVMRRRPTAICADFTVGQISGIAVGIPILGLLISGDGRGASLPPTGIPHGSGAGRAGSLPFSGPRSLPRLPVELLALV